MKKIFACFLCLIMVAIPLVQRSYAVVTTTTVVVILILTLLTAMGITLVIAEGTKEQFIQQKGDAFMTSKGYSGTFADWISGGQPIEVALKLGMLVLAKDVVDRIKEFVNWLIPGASSNTTVDLSTNSGSTIDGFIVCDGYVNSSGRFVITSVGSVYNQSNTGQIISANGNVLQYTLSGTNGKLILTGGYYKNTGEPANLSGVTIYQRSNTYMNFTLFRLNELTTYNNQQYYPGVYLCVLDSYNSRQSLLDISIGSYYPFSLNDILVDTTSAAAQIGTYNNLSDLTNQTVTDNGTTIINNTFYITQDGQALNPSGESLDDIINALQQALDNLNRKLEVIPQTAATEAEGTVSPDYSDFNLGDLDLSGLGALLTTRFPFSIPWDFVRIFTLFSADPVAPSWEVDLLPLDDFENVDTTVTLDLGQYPIVGQVSRWFCIIDLCLGLCFITKRLIWVA